MHPNTYDLDGKKFNFLTATNKVKKRNGITRRLCHCDCGKSTWIITALLINGNTKSCGCKQFCGNRLPNGISVRNRVLREYQRHAKERGLCWRLSDTTFDELTKGLCFFCGRSPYLVRKSQDNTGEFLYNGIDRKNNKRGYVKSNVVPCCKVCNRAKNNMSFDDFMEWIWDLKNHA